MPRTQQRKTRPFAQRQIIKGMIFNFRLATFALLVLTCLATAATAQTAQKFSLAEFDTVKISENLFAMFTPSEEMPVVFSTAHITHTATETGFVFTTNTTTVPEYTSEAWQNGEKKFYFYVTDGKRKVKISQGGDMVVRDLVISPPDSASRGKILALLQSPVLLKKLAELARDKQFFVGNDGIASPVAGHILLYRKIIWTGKFLCWRTAEGINPPRFWFIGFDGEQKQAGSWKEAFAGIELPKVPR